MRVDSHESLSIIYSVALVDIHVSVASKDVLVVSVPEAF